jgi:hydroxymethylpyrimidine pyrophosphatase-like HAD family hydrolase
LIRLFVLDIDGCISHPFKTPDWESISEIRELNIRSRQEAEIPALTLCTGRPLPYAEAVAQWLDIRLPFVFESALLYHPVRQKILTPNGPWPNNGDGKTDSRSESGGKDVPAREKAAAEGQNSGQTAGSKGSGTDDPTRQIDGFRNWLNETLLPKYPDAVPEFSKMIDAGVVSSNKVLIDQIYKEIIQAREELFPGLEVHRTEVSVNTLPPGNNKSTGIDLISREHNLPFTEMAYIGDSEADIGPLKRVKMPFAPSNAIKPVREAAEALEQETSRAVLEAYQRIIERNRSDA